MSTRNLAYIRVRNLVATFLIGALFYAFSFGPAARAVEFGHLSLRAFLTIYVPFTGMSSFSRGMQSYAKVWLPERQARDSWIPEENTAD
ncbi:MAG TPA: hypothetical protein VK961_00345 [Chthoniobacter sp.]|nr:hypothetical protein [Chthoniobacter sp.]